MTTQEIVDPKSGLTEIHASEFDEAVATVSTLMKTFGGIDGIISAYPLGLIVVGPSDKAHHHDYPEPKPGQGHYIINHFSTSSKK